MAAEELRRILTNFVENVTLQLIKQLLDELSVIKVLNEEEKDAVLEENLSRADKARELIKMVRKKGNKASEKMIAILEKKDEGFFLTLGLTSATPPPPLPASQPKEQINTSPDVPDSAIPKDSSVYPVNKASPRLALIITNITFQNAKLNRSGAEKDVENMEKLLRGLRCEVVKYKNLTGKKIEEAVMEFSKDQRLQRADSVFVVIMSHGRMGFVFGVGWRKEDPPLVRDEFPTDKIYKYLDTQSCPALLDKPKVIIIQACRGENDGAVIVSDGPGDIINITPDSACSEETQTGPGLLEDDALHYRHKEKDFISFLSCTPDTVSYRETGRGSLLIQYIVEVFDKFARKDDIEELFRKVMQRFEEFPYATKRQMPTKDRCTLARRFFLLPDH